MDITIIIFMSFMIISLSFMMNYTHFLLSLLCLEGMMLMTVLLIPLIFQSSSPIHQMSLMLLTFSACEASLGLSLIVKMSRSYGSDLLSSSSINSC